MTRMYDFLRAMDRFTGTTQQERHDDPAPYEDTPAQRAEAAVGLARHLSAGHPGARSLAEALDAEIAAARLEVIFADAICCSECGVGYDDAYWQAVYPDGDIMPEVDEFVCDRCRFGDESADELPEDSLVTSWQEAENEAVASGELGGDEWEDEPLHYEPGWVPHMAPEGPDPDDAA